MKVPLIWIWSDPDFFAGSGSRSGISPSDLNPDPDAALIIDSFLVSIHCFKKPIINNFCKTSSIQKYRIIYT